MDVNPISVASAVFGMVKSDFPQFQQGTNPTDAEIQLAKQVLQHFYAILTDFTFQEEMVLDSSTSQPESEISSYSETLVDDAGTLIKEENTEIISTERKEEILKFLTAHPRWSITSLHRYGFREYKHTSYKKRWEEHVKRGGTTFEKYSFIDKFVFEQFQEARKDFKFVKERDLQLWGIQAAQSFRDPTFVFKGSASWLRDFKQRHGISSRKVTKLIGRRELMTTEDILEAAKRFQSDFRIHTSAFNPEHILNTDQVGFEYELVGKRTLSFVGEKNTLGAAKSPTNLATHSYTVQYVISMAGKIVGDVFICLQERSGRLGPKIREELFPAANVSLTCSVSGKLTTSLYEYFLDQVVVKNVKEDFLFMIDSWGGQTSTSTYANRFGIDGKPMCTLKIIPKRCTSICQPLDTTFHRQLKYFAKAIFSEASLKYATDVNPADEVTTRNNIIRLHSLLHNQFCADVFQPMIRYSWYSAGLTDNRPTFLSVKEACFSFDKTDSALCTLNCKNPRFVKCAHCRKIICFTCFYYDYHFHQL